MHCFCNNQSHILSQVSLKVICFAMHRKSWASGSRFKRSDIYHFFLIFFLVKLCQKTVIIKQIGIDFCMPWKLTTMQVYCKMFEIGWDMQKLTRVFSCSGIANVRTSMLFFNQMVTGHLDCGEASTQLR